jgi:hypothetical protein
MRHTKWGTDATSCGLSFPLDKNVPKSEKRVIFLPGPVLRTVESFSLSTQSIQSAKPWHVPASANSIYKITCKYEFYYDLETQIGMQTTCIF